MDKDNKSLYMKRFREEQKSAGVKRISVTVTEGEYKRIKESADSHNQLVTTHLKSLAISYLDGNTIVPAHISERLDELISILRGVGNNLNQLARYSNEMRYFLDTEEVRLNMRRIEDSVIDFLKTKKE